MKKFLMIGVTLILLGAIAILIVFSMDWGGRTSTIDKTDIVEAVDSVDASGNRHPGLDDLNGLYTVTTKDGKAELLFTIDGLKETQGAFEEFEVKFNIEEDFTRSQLEVYIKSGSINTENDMRDEHLKEADYFDIQTYPDIVFLANEIRFTDTIYVANGTLDFLGNKRAMEITFDHMGGQDINGKHIEVFEGGFEFDRTAYGMEEESGIGNVVSITFYVELEQQ